MVQPMAPGFLRSLCVCSFRLSTKKTLDALWIPNPRIQDPEEYFPSSQRYDTSITEKILRIGMQTKQGAMVFNVKSAIVHRLSPQSPFQCQNAWGHGTCLHDFASIAVFIAIFIKIGTRFFLIGI